MNIRIPGVRRRLSWRLLILTAVFVMLSEVAIYVPSIARFRQVYLEQRLSEANLATLALRERPRESIDRALDASLLRDARLLAIEVWNPPRSELMLGAPVMADASFDLRDETPWVAIREAFAAMAHGGERVIRVYGPPPMAPGRVIEVYMDESQLATEMFDYSRRILTLSVIISLITAGLVYLTLQWLMVLSLRRITGNLVAFRQHPEAQESIIRPSDREDEIGLMETELARMQGEVRAALTQKTRLAALGDAVSRINHDLNGILSTVSMASDRLARMEDAGVARVARLLVNSVQKAVDLCTQTQDLARGDQAVPRRSRFLLSELVNEVGAGLSLGADQSLTWDNRIDPSLGIEADRERLYRVLMNLGRNAWEAAQGSDQGSDRGVAHITIEGDLVDGGVQVWVRDRGPGIPSDIQARLFEPFAASGRSGGTGLGLPTSRDLMRSHGGDLQLVSSGPDGTVFRLWLPNVAAGFDERPCAANGAGQAADRSHTG
jgi:signal transduction histidine kinase